MCPLFVASLQVGSLDWQIPYWHFLKSLALGPIHLPLMDRPSIKFVLCKTFLFLTDFNKTWWNCSTHRVLHHHKVLSNSDEKYLTDSPLRAGSPAPNGLTLPQMCYIHNFFVFHQYLIKLWFVVVLSIYTTTSPSFN